MATITKTRTFVAPATRHSMMTRAANLLAVAVGIGVNFSVHLVGDLYLSELLLLLTLPLIIILRGRRALGTNLNTLYVLMGVWLLGLVIADAYNHIPLTDRMRGVAAIVFFGLNIFGLSILLRQNEKRKLYFLVGLMVGSLAVIRLQPNDATLAYPWKFGYAYGTMQAVLLISSYFYGKRRYLLSGSFIVGICAVNLIFNYRGPILELLLTLALVYPIIPEQVGRLRILPESQVARLIVIALLAVGAAAAANGAVKFVTRAGYVSEDAQAKNEAQEKSGNLLLGGRPEFVIGLRAALDNPIIGHGSWPKDIKYFEMLYDWTIETGAQQEQRGGDIAEEADGLIPGHSHIVTAWVWAGIAGLVFWMYVIWFISAGILRLTILRPSFAPIYAWFLISMFWDILFSPFGAGRRTIEAAMIIVVADLMEKKVAMMRPSWRRMGARRPGLAMSINRPSISPGLR